MDGDSLVRVEKLVDPREVFCRAFNAADVGHTARPLADGESVLNLIPLSPAEITYRKAAARRRARAKSAAKSKRGAA